VLAFKACYYGLRAARRLGWRPGDAGMVRVAAPPAETAVSTGTGRAAAAR
jgi:hypothetical protein